MCTVQNPRLYTDTMYHYTVGKYLREKKIDVKKNSEAAILSHE